MEPFAFEILCALASVVFASTASDALLSRSLMAAGFLLVAVLLGIGYRAELAATSGVIAAVAALCLFQPATRRLAQSGAGALAALWARQLQELGLPPAAAAVVAIVPPAVAAVLAARRIGFAPRDLREEALASIAVLALTVALLPSVVDGWQSARVLNAGRLGVASHPPAAWVMVAGAAALAAGAGFAAWRRS